MVKKLYYHGKLVKSIISWNNSTFKLNLSLVLMLTRKIKIWYTHKNFTSYSSNIILYENDTFLISRPQCESIKILKKPEQHVVLIIKLCMIWNIFLMLKQHWLECVSSQASDVAVSIIFLLWFPRNVFCFCSYQVLPYLRIF